MVTSPDLFFLAALVDSREAGFRDAYPCKDYLRVRADLDPAFSDIRLSSLDPDIFCKPGGLDFDTDGNLLYIDEVKMSLTRFEFGGDRGNL